MTASAADNVFLTKETTMKIQRRMVAAAMVSAGLLAHSLTYAEGTIKIGLLATFEGPFTVLGEDGLRGAMVAIGEFNGKAGGKKIEIVRGSSDASPDWFFNFRRRDEDSVLTRFACSS